tara:strand:+ start:40 stop:1455 length:1416 start_codon:yes stop_codon:yes gene_type:complete
MTIELDGVNNTLKTDKIEPQSGTALQVGASGDTITLPSGATLNIAGTISNSGTATGFGAIDWQTSDVKTGNFTAVAGKGYFVNTTSGAITVSLPAGSAGAQIALIDYAGTWDSNNCIVSANGSEKIQGATTNVTLSRDREAIQIVYVDSTQGWLVESVADQGGSQIAYTSATGGTITTSGDYKIHTFTSSGNFVVSTVGNAAGGGAGASYVVVAGGASGSGVFRGGGGGAGGFREGKNSGDPYTASPLNAPAGLTLTATTYPITVGAGGAKVTGQGAQGANSVFSTITSAGGGRGGIYDGANPTYTPYSRCSSPRGFDGGSGGGGAGTNPSPNNNGGAGNTPPVSPPQGNPGGAGSQTAQQSGGGGGGAGGAGAGGATPGNPGGAGVTSSITSSPTAYAGGGGGGGYCSGGPGCGGSSIGGSGGCGASASPGNDAAANTGSGGGGSGGSPTNSTGGGGGSGVVIIRYKYQN